MRSFEMMILVWVILSALAHIRKCAERFSTGKWANHRTRVPDPTTNNRALAPGGPPLLYAGFYPWRRVDLNHRPLGYEPSELPLLYGAAIFIANRIHPRNHSPRSGVSEQRHQYEPRFIKNQLYAHL